MRVEQRSHAGGATAPEKVSSTPCICVSDATRPDHPLVYISPGFTELTGYRPSQVLGRNNRFLQGPLTDPMTIDRIREAVRTGTPIECDILNYRCNGTTYFARLTIDPLHDADGNVTHYLAYQRELTASSPAATVSPPKDDALASVIEHLPGYFFRRMMLRDQSVEYSFLSRSLFRILGLPEDTEWPGAEFLDHIHPDDRAGFLRNVIHSGLTLTPSRTEFRLRSASGEDVWFRSDSTPRAVPNGCVVWEGIAVDVTAEKRAEARVGELARHDLLTGLSNRLLFQAALEAAVAEAAAGVGGLLILAIDLDDFGVLNEEWGSAVADRVLQIVSERLEQLARQNDGIAARMGGDKFGLMVRDAGGSQTVEALMEGVIETLREPMEAEGRTLYTDACVGAALSDNVSPTAPLSAKERAIELIKRSEFALHRAKQQGQGSCLLYTTALDDRVQRRMALRASLQQGVAAEQFELHYQPLVNLQTGHILGAEALVRWNHPELGVQRPDLFIPYAETSGLIVPLGAWVIREAMRQARAWAAQGLPVPRLSINLSSVQLQRPGLLETIETALRTYDARPEDFDLELTESALLGASPSVNGQLARLRELGFGLAVDDFGTGYSTFRYLRDFPVNKVKIDQTFVRQLVIGSSDAMIVKAMIALTSNLKLDVIAEGVETAPQRDFLVGEGCWVGQGYLFSPPLCAEDFAWLLQQRAPLPYRADRT
jgi:diguanylate cyclase (GGDEF)-like protein/PAS domain S-box-containing protein